jgi:phosphohistidine phosphatase SixA
MKAPTVLLSLMLSKFWTLALVLGALFAAILPGHVVALNVPVLTLAEAAKKLSAGGYVLMMRHGETEAGIGDPPGFKLDDCKSQRNLSTEGKAQLKRFGEAFKASGIQVHEVVSSEWCRCQETADLVFGKHTSWTALNSFFSNVKRTEAQQTAELRAVLPYIKPPKNAVWVTHQVNITALTGFVPGAAEVLALRWQNNQVIAEFRFAQVN